MAEFVHNGMARCGSCGEPAVPVISGSVPEVEANPLIEVRCRACAMTEAAEAILSDAMTEGEANE